ncbi:Sodium/calcium exchanger protein-domain-containing protein [Globomyces pollinis-pini]|nr:Sodium/calcium exchanger protein-domain-containing protein [Globomyces pollinis-pini]
MNSLCLNSTIEHTIGFVDYLDLYACSNNTTWIIILFLIVLLILFLALKTAAEVLFCPNLCAIAYLFEIPENVAGITLVAFGNGAPDIFSTIIAFQGENVPLALGELFGATLFIALLVVGIIAILIPMELKKKFVERDLLFLLVAMVITFLFVKDGVLELYESLILLLYYVVYVLYVIHSSPKPTIANLESPLLEVYVQSPVTIESETSRMSLHTSFSEEGGLHPHDFPSAVPSDHSLYNESDFDVDYFQPSLHFRHSFPSHSHHRKGNSYWNRRSFYEPRTTVPTDIAATNIQEDVLSYAPLHLDLPSPENEFKQSLRQLFPVFYEWNTYTITQCLVAIFESPLIFFFQITVPVVLNDYLKKDDYTPVPQDETDVIDIEDTQVAESKEYPKTLLLTQLFLAPICITFISNWHSIHIFAVPLWFYSILTGLLLSTSIFLFTKATPISQLNLFICIFGFLQTIMYFLAISNELVSLLETIGIISGIRQSIIGLTISAVGNCIGEMITNISIAQYGLHTMAISACYGAPMLSNSID